LHTLGEARSYQVLNGGTVTIIITKYDEIREIKVMDSCQEMDGIDDQARKTYDERNFAEYLIRTYIERIKDPITINYEEEQDLAKHMLDTQLEECDKIYDDFWKIEEERISNLSPAYKEHEECRKRYHADGQLYQDVIHG
jgi:hypothetical protein